MHTSLMMQLSMPPMLTNVLKALQPIQPDKSNSNNNAEVVLVPPDDLSDEVTYNQDLDKARVVYERLMEGRHMPV